MRPFARTILSVLLFLALSLPTSAHSAKQKESHNNPTLTKALNELDHLLDHSDVYTSKREERIKFLEKQLSEAETPEAEYGIVCTLFAENESYNFDKALSYAGRAIDIATALGSHERLAESQLSMAYLYTRAGMYAESMAAFDRIDTVRMAPIRWCEYYKARIHLNRDFRDHSRDESMKQSSERNLQYYRRALYELSHTSKPIAECYRRDSLLTRLLEHYDAHNYEDALECALSLESVTATTEHDYAIVAYYLSVVYESMAAPLEQMIWLARSAATDIRLAVKDHASLCALATLRAAEGDVERAFRYIRTSTDDAMLYNAKLRQWQVANRMTTIENAYHLSVEEKQRFTVLASILLSVLAAVLLLACIYVAMLLRRTARAKADLKIKNDEVVRVNEALRQTNRQLSELNLSIAEANMVKEEYIALFLSMCSDYIDRIASIQRRVRKGIKSGSMAELSREFPSSDIIEAEKEHFYETFDSAFLNLYPNFVDEFNALLDDDGKIELKKGERLNTELRIFALIRLGITDSSKIALLLHYSVNTIYNYRAKVKNHALCDRDDFEQVIRTIGSFTR